MAFKLGDKRVNPLKSKGFMNANPFKSNGNTMAYANGEPEGGPKKEPAANQEEAKKLAKEESDANVKTKEPKVVSSNTTTKIGEKGGKKGVFTTVDEETMTTGDGSRTYEKAFEIAKEKGYLKPGETREEYIERAKSEQRGKTSKTTFKADENPRPEPPKTDYSYLDGASIKQGYRDGDGTMYGNQVASNVGGNGAGSGDQREGEDPMSRYLNQEELDYLYEKRGSRGPRPKAGYDDFYSDPNKKLFKPGSISAFDKAVRDGLIDKDGKTIPLNPQIKKDNLVEEVSPGFNSKI